MKNRRPKGPLSHETTSPQTSKKEEEEEDQPASHDRLGLLGAMLAGAKGTPPQWLLALGEVQVRGH